jgi:cytochrome c-type biogenesis protein CcmH
MEPTQAPLDKLKQQLAQLQALSAEGVLTGEAARSAREALEQQIVALVLSGAGSVPSTAGPTPDSAMASSPPPAGTNAPVRVSGRWVLGLAGFVVVFTAAGYAWLGNPAAWSVAPGEPGAPAQAADASAHSTNAANIDAMVARLVEKLKEKPDDAEGWTMLGRTYSAQSKLAEASQAYKKALDLKPNDAQMMADYADALAVANNRSLDGEPTRLVMAAVKLDPNNVKALALAGTIAFNQGDFKQAVSHWENAMRHADPASEFTKQLAGAVTEARQRAGMPPGADALASLAPPAGAPGATASPAPGPAASPQAGEAVVSGRVSLKPGLQGVSPDDVVFIFARAPSGSKMPLALLRKKVSDLPLDFKLDDSLAMSPAANLSSVSQVVVGARVSKTGQAMPAPGDWQGLSAPIAVGTRNLKLEIAEPIK